MTLNGGKSPTCVLAPSGIFLHLLPQWALNNSQQIGYPEIYQPVQLISDHDNGIWQVRTERYTKETETSTNTMTGRGRRIGRVEGYEFESRSTKSNDLSN